MSKPKIQHTWIIKNWKDVVHNEALIQNTKTEVDFEVGNFVYAKFVVQAVSERNKYVGLNWKITNKHPHLENTQVYLVANILNSEGNETKNFEVYFG